ncbi:hypothetical protein BKI52_05995 [marine bacterium AO1-C]|nr:hypothetical protein BKI52_05995 [marine bacterium AO1-C]
MNNFKYNNESNEASPQIYLDVLSGKCSITGNSYIENARQFYKPVLSWINDYAQIGSTHQQTLKWDIKLYYINSTSKKTLVVILKKLSSYQNKGGKVSINWHCSPQDNDLLEEITLMAEASNMTINILDI